MLQGLRKFEIIVIIALYLELQSNKTEKVLMEKVQDRCEAILGHLKNDAMSHRKLKPDVGAQGPAEGEVEVDDFERQEEIKCYENWKHSFLTTTMFREIVKRL